MSAIGAAFALLAFSFAPTVALLTVASVAIGLGASITQMILPFAVSLGEPKDRGRIVGNVMGGVLAGILLSRTVSGMLGGAFGWRVVFLCAACVMAIVAMVVRVFVPVSPPTTTLPYRTLLASLARIFVRERLLRRRAVIGALGFASFMMFWSTIAYHVAHEGIGGRVGARSPRTPSRELIQPAHADRARYAAARERSSSPDRCALGRGRGGRRRTECSAVPGARRRGRSLAQRFPRAIGLRRARRHAR